MILLTHNMLRSPMKGATQKLPLVIEVSEEPESVVDKEREFNDEFLKATLAKIDWPSFVAATETLRLQPPLPASVGELNPEDDAQLKVLHHHLLEVHVEKGNLLDTETGRRFPISNGIPNMLLNQDEV
mmetsp:Transcript_47658/g.112166  ORF Transcript_47658/g.112166 Transcript_47658/m.112166 type:complete len:128 (-) Transcript_47658:24-407(-)